MSSKKKAAAKKTFKQAVEATPDVKNAFAIGLTGLGAHRTKVELADTRRCEGSLDIDTTVTAKYPNDPRWDYAFSYKGEVFFVEVHSANTGEVSALLRKLEWLKGWLHHKAPEINKLKATSKTPFYWIQSKGYHILKKSKQERKIAQGGLDLKPISKLSLK